MYPASDIGHIVFMVELANLFEICVHSITISPPLTSSTTLPSAPTYTEFPLPTFNLLPPPPPHHSTTTVSMAVKAFNFIKRNTPNVATTLAKISKSTSTTIKAFITDLFCFSVTETTSSMGIPVYYFFASGAAGLAIVSYFPKLHEETNVSFKDMVGVEVRVPGNAPLKAVNMPQPMLDRDDSAYWDMLYLGTHLGEASGVVVNTFPELEPLAVNAVAGGACFADAKEAPPVFYIGPLIAEPQLSGLVLFVE